MQDPHGRDYADDLFTITTPEGIEIDLMVAGLGSRFVAALIDTSIQAVLVGALAVVTITVGAVDAVGGWFTAVAFVVLTLILFGYHTLFEVLDSGRSPGKRVAGLRLVADDGSAAGVLAVVIRNLFRLVDFLPSMYLVGALAVVATRRHQRLGDLAAGVLIVRERASVPLSGGAVLLDPSVARVAAGWDVSAISAEQVATLRSFLARRTQLDDRARARLAAQLAGAVSGQVAGVPPGIAAEHLLEGVVAAKDGRR